MFFSNLTFDFDLILGSIFTFRGPIGLFLDLVSRDVPTGYFLSFGGYPNVFCALLVHHSLPCRLFSRDVTAWLFRLYWILFPEMFPTGYFVSSGGYPNVFCALLMHHSLPCRLFSRDVTVWLIRLYWILLPEMSQLVISSLLED